MRHIIGLRGVVVLAAMLPMTASAVTLDSLLDDRRISASERAVASEQDRLRGERDERRQERGWELFGGTDAGRYRDLEVSAAGDRFSSYGLTLGVRHPLLGTWQRQQRAVQEGQHAVERQEALRLEAAEAQRLALKTAYADWWRADTEMRLCENVMPDLGRLRDRVQRRQERGDVRGSSWMSLELRAQTFERDCQRAKTLRDQARRRLEGMVETPERLHGNVHPTPVALLDRPADIARWEQAIQGHPRIEDRRLALRQAESLPQQRWYHHVDSNVALSHRAEQRFGGGDIGTGLVASLNFSVPLDRSLLQGHAGNRSQSALRDRSRWELEAESDALKTELYEALERHREALEERRFRERQRHQVERLEQEIERRYDLDERVGSGDLLDVRLDRIQVEQEWIRAWHGNWLRQAELELISDSLPRRYRLLSAPVAWPGSWYSDRAETHWTQAVYVWDSEALLDPEQRETELARLKGAGMNSVYVGLSAEQLTDSDVVDEQLSVLINAARERSLAVHLLLGEPRWMLDDYRDHLLEIVRSLDHLEFESLHLDLEVEQLGWPVEEEWLRGWVKTMEQVAEISPWPLSLSAHHRWFRSDAPGQVCIPCALRDLPIDHVSLMIYSTNQDQVSRWLEEITDNWSELPLRLAQSIEPEPVLGESESWAGRSQQQLEHKVEDWRVRFAPLGIEGIDWQEWRYFPRSANEES